MTSDPLSPTQRALLAIETLKAKVAALEGDRSEPIAIISLACRFPGGADSPEAFWELLRSGQDAITEVPSDRWNADALTDTDPDAPGKTYSRYGGFVPHPYHFDAQFFRISPREALHLDPQQRLLLEVVWEALERGAIAPDSLEDSPTGTFLGICGNDYWNRCLVDLDHIDAYVATGNAHSIAAGRLAYHFGFTGPALAVDTACSSSLVAVHLACRSLRQGECDLAVAAGVNRILSPETSINFAKSRMLSRDGRCKTFDADADGFGRAEGCGVVVLKRYRDARRDGDSILALIRGTATNHDGRSSGLTVPNGSAQQGVIRRALQDSRLEADDIDYIETHGTGTALGDPVEVGALAEVFGKTRPVPLTLASVKSHIGHSEAAAGIAGLVAVVLSLQQEAIPGNLHLKRLNPHVSWDDLPFRVPTTLQPWRRSDRPRRAGVSSFGFSGTNAHAILEEAPIPPSRDSHRHRPLHILTLSAKSSGALAELVDRYLQYLGDRPHLNLGDVCYSANSGRAHFNHRLAVVAASLEELGQKLQQWREGNSSEGVFSGRSRSLEKTDIIYRCQIYRSENSAVVPARELYDTEPTFRQAIDRCCEILETPLVDRLTSPDAALPVTYATIELWKRWGIEPSQILGNPILAEVSENLETALRQPSQPALSHPGFTIEIGDRSLQGCGDWGQLLSSLAQLYVFGVSVDWNGFDSGFDRAKLVLPTYPFQRRYFGLD
ncbi:type I polyketide synthase [Baaleninema sp.]|uniref:type I polyketide synthase n=1 Tax=Baaleninema sp. TaxID=3101197 RepID=UPI003D0450E4